MFLLMGRKNRAPLDEGRGSKSRVLDGGADFRIDGDGGAALDVDERVKRRVDCALQTRLGDGGRAKKRPALNRAAYSSGAALLRRPITTEAP